MLLCLVILFMITINLRGVRETGAIFMLPTYLFIATLLIAIGIGCWKSVLSGGHPLPIMPLPRPQTAPQTAMVAASAWLLIKAFASGWHRDDGR